MEKYSHFTNEITRDELYDKLLGCGLFAERIPNFLTGEQFRDYSKTIAVPTTTVKDKDYVRYSSMRNINVPRSLAIPHPFAYANLCKILSDNWNRLQAFFRFRTRNQEFKVSRIHIRKLVDNCALFEMNYKNFTKDGEPENEILVKSRFVVNADISNCFPSIYSHSIPWALKGKSYAKAVKNDKTMWFNQLDFYNRNLKYGETNGILIGPHASNLISEIALVAIDFELVNMGYKFVRFIDDYRCYVESYEKAETFLVDLSTLLKKYELKLNDKKSEIIPLPQASVTRWVTKISNYIFQNTYVTDGRESLRLRELKAFLDYAISLSTTENNNAAILKYSIKVISKYNLSENAKQYFVNQIHHWLLLYPYLCHVLDEFFFEAFDIESNRVKTIALDLYEYGIRKKSYEANAYAVFWSLKYDFDLIELNNLHDHAEESEDAIFLLVSFLYFKKRRDAKIIKKYKRIARQLKKNDYDRYWIFIYEVLSWNELSAELRVMKRDGNVSFIRDAFR